MIQIKKPIIYLMMTVLFVLFTCQSSETTKEVYPENEIPVSSISDEAMQEFITGLNILDQKP